jgi:hypothetical protein
MPQKSRNEKCNKNTLAQVRSSERMMSVTTSVLLLLLLLLLPPPRLPTPPSCSYQY